MTTITTVRASDLLLTLFQDHPLFGCKKNDIEEWMIRSLLFIERYAE